MTPEKILKWINVGVLIVSSIYVIDFNLPLKLQPGELISCYSPYIVGGHRSGSGYKSDVELVLETTNGKITVLKEDIIPIKSGSEINLYKTSLLSFFSKVELRNTGRTASTTSLLTSWFLAVGYLVILLSIVTIWTKNKSIIHNAGSLSLILVFGILIALTLV